MLKRFLLAVGLAAGLSLSAGQPAVQAQGSEPCAVIAVCEYTSMGWQCRTDFVCEAPPNDVWAPW